MKNFKIFALSFVLIMCGAFVLSACDKDKKPEEPIVAIESTVNPRIIGSVYKSAGSVLATVTIDTTDGDTEGSIVWQTPSMLIVEGENEYTWVFTPEDTERYKTTTGTLTLIGSADYELSLEIDDWTYGEVGDEPRIMGYTGSPENMSVVYTYYKNGSPLDEKPVDAGEYNVKATVTISGLSDPINVWPDDYKFIINKAQISDFGLAIENWEYDRTPKQPTVNEDLSGININYLYSNQINGAYTSLVPVNAGTYYVKAEINDNNYFGESAPVAFEIEKATLTSMAYSDEIIVEYVEGLTVADIDLANGWSWKIDHEDYSTALVVGDNYRAVIYSNENYINDFHTVVIIKVIDNK